MAAPMEESNDKFRESFKFYKRRKPPPDMRDVIDFTKPNDYYQVVPVTVEVNAHPGLAGMHPADQWKVYGLQDVPGFFFIANPFKPGCQRYWVQQCLSRYPRKPNVTNLDIHMELGPQSSIWQQTEDKKDKNSLLWKLRWVTLGYHYDWTNKVYYEDRHTEFPHDLSTLTTHMAAVLGFKKYSAQAAIVNFYHLDSTLSGHTDHSEFDHEAPLFSLSFGQPAVFLLGGLTKAAAPTAMYVRSGDVVVMSGACRLAYHAVPKVLPTQTVPDCFMYNPVGSSSSNHGNPEENKGQIQKNDEHEAPSNIQMTSQDFPTLNETEKSSPKLNKNVVPPKSDISDHCHKGQGDNDQRSSYKLNKLDVEHQIEKIISDTDWKPYADYLECSRININVRQVLKQGQSWPQATECSCCDVVAMETGDKNDGSCSADKKFKEDPNPS